MPSRSSNDLPIEYATSSNYVIQVVSIASELTAATQVQIKEWPEGNKRIRFTLLSSDCFKEIVKGIY